MFHVKQKEKRFSNSRFTFSEIVSHETLQSEIIAGIMTAQ